MVFWVVVGAGAVAEVALGRLDAPFASVGIVALVVVVIVGRRVVALWPRPQDWPTRHGKEASSPADGGRTLSARGGYRRHDPTTTR